MSIKQDWHTNSAVLKLLQMFIYYTVEPCSQLCEDCLYILAIQTVPNDTYLFIHESDDFATSLRETRNKY